MELYILDNKKFEVQSVCRPCSYNLNLDDETNGKSEFVLQSLQSAQKGYFIVLNGLFKQFLFVIDDVITTKGESKVTISALDISNMFDRKIISKNEGKMVDVGIESFIADTMDENFINSDDSVLNLSYVDVYIKSNTKANVATNAEDNLYNFHTFLSNCRQYRDVYTEFSIDNHRLKIEVGNKQEVVMLVDTTLAEVTGYNKVYEVDPVTKVQAYIREDGSIYNLYLKSDRTTTTNKNDENRLAGRIETISCDTLENAREEALNIIKSNSYKHLVEFRIAKTSKLIDIADLYIGRLIKIKTEDSIYDSYISAIELSDENFVSFKSGNLRIDFTDKQKIQERSGVVGNKLDISGGNITGTLKVKGEKVLTVEDIEDKVNRIGDTMTGSLHIENMSDFAGIIKTRKIEDTNYSNVLGVGADKAAKMQLQRGGIMIAGIELNEDGTIYNEKTGKQLVEVERVTGTNGTALKYADGTMICYGAISKTVNITTSYEGAYYADVNNNSFPVSFVAAPIVTTNIKYGSGLIASTVSGLSNGTFSVFVWKNQAKSNVSLDIQYIAIGKWQ